MPEEWLGVKSPTRTAGLQPLSHPLNEATGAPDQLPPPPEHKRHQHRDPSFSMKPVTPAELQSFSQGGFGGRPPPNTSPPPKGVKPPSTPPAKRGALKPLVNRAPANNPASAQAPALRHTHGPGIECAACVAERQQSQLEAMRQQLTHAKTEVVALEGKKELYEQQTLPSSPRSAAAHGAALQGLGDNLGYYKDQVRQLKFAVAQAEAHEANTEDLLREALQRPPTQPSVPIRDSGAQTVQIDPVEVLVSKNRADSDAASSSDSADERETVAHVKAAGLDHDSRVDLVSRVKTAVGPEVKAALQRHAAWLFGNQQGGAVREVEEGKNDKRAAFALPRLALDETTSLSPEELFYEMCAALGEAYVVSENQAIQINNAYSFSKLMNAGIVPIKDSVADQILQHETLNYIAHRVLPIHYCNKPLGFLFSRVVRAAADADMVVKRQEEGTQAAVHGYYYKPLDESTGDEIEAPSSNQWIDLTKRLIILLSKYTQCLQPQLVFFEYEDQSLGVNGKTKKYAPLEFAVDFHLDEIVLQICDAQERLALDYWECAYGFPFHKALEMGAERDNAIRYMLRAASSCADDRFGLLKPRDNDGILPFYLALMYAHDVPGVMDPLLDILIKRNFKLNLKWTGTTQTDPPEEWHLLQWAAYQGVDRIFKQTRTHPDFFQKCQTSQEPAKEDPPQGNQPLHLACMSGAAGVVALLCHEISQVLKSPTGAIWTTVPTPLHLAAQQCYYNCIQTVLDFAKDKWGWSAKMQEEKLFGSIEYRTKWFGAAEEFEYSVYSVALLTLVYRRQKLLELTDVRNTNEDDDIVANNEDEIARVRREIEVANHQVKFLNERHPPKLRAFAQTRIKKYFYPWLLFIGMVTFFAASETVWFSDFVFNSSLAIQSHFENLSYLNAEGQDKTLSNLDTQDELIEWVYRMLSETPNSFKYTHTRPVGLTRVRQIIISDDSCTIESRYFRRTVNGVVPCAGGVSSPRSSLFFIDWLFHTLLSSPRDDYVQHTEPIPLLSGATSTWKRAAETEETSIISNHGYEYPGSGYVLDIDWGNPAGAQQALDDFRGTPGQRFGSSDGWMQLGTRALFVSMTFYNPATTYYISGRWLFELPPYGGVFMQNNWKSIRLTREYDSSIEYFTLVVEILLAVIVFLMTCRKVQEFRYILKEHFVGMTVLRIPSYISSAILKIFSRGSNLLDLATIAAFVAVFALRLLIRQETIDLERLFSVHTSAGGILETSFYFPFQEISTRHDTRQSALGIVLMFVYMKILVIVRLHKNMGPISLAIVQTLFNARILFFGVILVLLLLALSFAAYFAWGESSNEYSSMFLSLLTLFRLIFGEYWEFEAVRQNHSIFGPLLLLFMVLFGSLLLINVLTAIIFDIYRERNAKSEGSWETDLVDMQINDTLHMLHRKGLMVKKEEDGEAASGIKLLRYFGNIQNGALISSEVKIIIEWDRRRVYSKVFEKCPSLFPDASLEFKALKDWIEEQRTTDEMLEAAGERCREATDRTEAIERHVKDLNKLVTEIHERLFPKGAHAVGGPPAVSLLGHSSLASMRGRTVPDVLDHWSTNNA